MSPGPPDEEHAESLIEDILQRAEPSAVPDDDTFELLTCLFADIRGYTKFTQEHGDGAAAKLTAKFATVVHDLVGDFDGTVVELRGDEALCVFTSPRQCLRLAIALQQRFVEETAADPSLPMPVGIGIDAGEVVRVADGYRGGALNLAARLCAQAKAGQVLASQEVTHLARTIDGIGYTLLDRMIVRGLPDPVRPVLVRPDGEDPAHQIAALLIEPTQGATRVRWLPGPFATRPRLALSALAAVAVLVAGLVVVLARDSGGQQLSEFAENSLGIIDPTTGRLVGEVSIPDGPTAVAGGFGYIWTANIDANSVTKVDASTHQVVDTIEVGVAPSAITAGSGSVWVVNSGDGTVSRINPTSDRAQAIPVGNVPSDVIAANGSVWVTNSADGTVSRIDPLQNSADKPIPVGSGPRGISAGHDIWVANSASDTITEIDGLGDTIQTPHVGCNPEDLAVVGASVWVSCSGGNEITRIATTGSAVARPVKVGKQPGQLAAVDGRVWTALQGDGAIAEIDPDTDHATRVPVGPIPGGIASARGKLWVTTTIDPTRHKGGTLHLVGQLQSIDPVYVKDLDQASVLASSYDGLLAFRRASGADGFSMVPDLATAIPEPTHGGRTYTFQLRDGIRWSTGKPVTATDVQRGVERTAANGLTPLAGLLVGASRCTEKRCDISGITVDNAARTVTFRLVHPSGNFLDLLANGSYAVPAGTPLAEDVSRPIPATGPYRIARYVPDKILILKRNGYFHEWSAAAQPDGFPDRIEYRAMPPGGSKHAIDDMAVAHTDWVDALDGGSSLTAYSVDGLQTRFGNRLHMTPSQNMYGLFLNTHLPPFNDPQVRQALAYAIDRNAVRDDWFGPGVVTCQFLPPDFPGYRPYCPYTSSTNAKSWQGTNIPKAEELVADLHPERNPVTVWSPPGVKGGFQHVVDALRHLGYHAQLRVWPDDSFAYFRYVFRPENEVQAGFMGWLIGDANAANIFSVYRCGAVGNLAEFCDHSLDRLMSRAERVQVTSVARSKSLWAEVERGVVDAAPWIPLVNPSSVDVLSTRVHNYKRSPVFGPLFGQMWVQ